MARMKTSPALNKDINVTWRPIDKLRPYASNARTHSDEQIEKIVASIREFGWTNPILVDETGTIVAGHARLRAATKAELTEVPVIELKNLTPAQVRAYVLADNQLSIFGAGWDEALLRVELQELKAADFDLDLMGFDSKELDEMMFEPPGDDKDPDAVPAALEVTVTQPGDVWLCGPHHLICGDSTRPEVVESLMQGQKADLICTDPPYCSGGFQETGKKAGSVGTDAKHKQIANDTLSTRGYSALLKAAFAQFNAPYLYCFTDWRMWTHLFDLAEASGFGVRSMIVWDKGTPGMGRGWRTQHELILWACRQTAPFDKFDSGAGNVIQAKRTGNINHTTEKPVEILETLIGNTPFAKVVVDPFNGSGTTLIACEKIGRKYRGVELDPCYCDTTVRRWQDFTGKQATRERDGQSFSLSE